MSWTIKTLIFCFCVNFFMAIAGISLGGADVINNFVTQQDGRLYVAQGLNDSVPTELSQGGISTSGNNDFTFIDAIKMTFNFCKFLLLSAFAPIYWGYILGFPMFLQLLLIPIQIMSIVGIIFLIRGDGN